MLSKKKEEREKTQRKKKPIPAGINTKQHGTRRKKTNKQRNKTNQRTNEPTIQRRRQKDPHKTKGDHEEKARKGATTKQTETNIKKMKT
jgi:hypothetical protein